MLAQSRWVWLGLLWIVFASLVLFFEYGQRPQLTVRWVTETEVNTAGFNIYRSEDREGPYHRLNEFLIPGAADPFIGGEYEYADATVERGITYYYQLEEVEVGGKQNRMDLVEARVAPARGWIVLIAAGVMMISAFFLLTAIRGNEKPWTKDKVESTAKE